MRHLHAPVSLTSGSIFRLLATLPAIALLLSSSPILQAEENNDGPEASSPFPRIARLGSIPDWSQLDPYQHTITREEFTYLLHHCYARKAADEYRDIIRIESDRALILKQSNHPAAGWYDLRFRVDSGISAEPPKFWRSPAELDRIPANSTRPLDDICIAIDPGHIGGRWVTWDDRHFTIGKDTLEVREGEMTLMVARILERDLSLLGATVILTRTDTHPVTTERIDTLQEEARLYLQRRKQIPSASAIASTAKKMFAISSEIRSRGDLLNESIQPDLALCLHFNASPWTSRRPSFRSPNHLHLLVNGCYSRGEIEEDDTRLEMLLRILQRVYYEELNLADAMSRTMETETRLPAFAYNGVSGMSVNDNELVWARNLLANRVFLCPVVFFEPYCMNHKEIHARVQAGQYDGLREINGIYRKNIYQEYADGITAGLVNYFRRMR